MDFSGADEKNVEAEEEGGFKSDSDVYPIVSSHFLLCL